MEHEGFKFTFYVKPFYSESENCNSSQPKPEERREKRARPVLALISNRNLNQSIRPYSHNAERHQIANKYVSLTQVGETLQTSNCNRNKKSSTYRGRSHLQDLPSFKNFKDPKDPKQAIKLFPVIHYYRKPRGLTPCALLRSKLLL